ncbi:hypothetical protein F4774DRAFT_391188, partial [Daldinia eschscholtzii]
MDSFFPPLILLFLGWRLGHQLARTSARRRRVTTSSKELGFGLGLDRHACIVGQGREHFSKRRWLFFFFFFFF